MPVKDNMTDLDEYTYVEKPFMDQLEGLGWRTLFLETDSPPEASYRISFREVLIEPELRMALKKIIR